MTSRRTAWSGVAVLLAMGLAIGGLNGPAAAEPDGILSGEEMMARADVANGRQQVIEHGCADCHGGGPNPASEAWLVGMRDSTEVFPIGPYITRPRNLTPDNLTGLGRFSERQIFNALRFGLRPGETPDVEITSSTPGQGNFPLTPKYLAPPMPWPAFRHMADQDIWDIAAYLKRAVKPVSNRVPDSDGPPDFWASTYTVEAFGPYPAAAFPTVRERRPE